MSISQSLTRSFISEQAALPDKTLKKLQEALETLREDPTNSKGKLDIKRLHEIDGFRLRLGDYRAIYTMEENVQTFRSVLLRSEVYRKLGIPDEDTLQIVPDTPLKSQRKKSIGQNSHEKGNDFGRLPHQLSKALLTSWRIPETMQTPLVSCVTEDDLLEAKVDYQTFSKVVDLLYSKKWKERLAQPQYILQRPSDLEDLANGQLTTLLLRLDEEQRNISAAGLEENKPIIVRGGPGSGKSTVALYRAKLLAERYPDAKIAYTTYTKALARASEEQLRALMPEDFGQVRVQTVDQLGYHQLGKIETIGVVLGPGDVLTNQFIEEAIEPRKAAIRRYNARYISGEIFDIIELHGLDTCEKYLASSRPGKRSRLAEKHRQLIWETYVDFMERVKNNKSMTWASLRRRTLEKLRCGELTAPYDFMIVDEGQDLSPETLQMLACMVKTPGGLYITADANQTLYESAFSWNALREGWPEATHYSLSKNYRNSAEVVSAIEELRQSIADQDSEVTLAPGGASGPKPEVVYCSPDDKEERLIQWLKETHLNAREPYKNMAILVAGDQKRAAEVGVKLSKSLKAQRINANYMSSKDLRLDADCIKILSFHTSKGLEFPVVVLWDVIEGVLPKDVSDLPSEEAQEEEIKERRLFYVGCSRAMRHLAVFTAEEEDEQSEFIGELSETLWNHHRKDKS